MQVPFTGLHLHAYAYAHLNLSSYHPISLSRASGKHRCNHY